MKKTPLQWSVFFMPKNFMKNKILVTGGAGYIGSHTCIALHEAGYDIVIYSIIADSSREAINRISTLPR